MLPNGTILTGYRIDGVVGQGGMGVVYEATQLSLNRTVALKLLAAHLSGDVAFRERFRREGQIQAGIDHPHIITVYEAGEDEQGLFMAMRLIRGPNLKDMIVRRELDAGRTLRILAPVADALDTAHGAGLIHRDIKPQNILVGAQDHPYLADFGLTKAPGEKSLTRTGQFVGTLDYVSPEQIQDRPATTSSDIYALAAVLYECLTGIVPYPKESEAAVLYAHMADPPPRISDQRPDLPAGLDDVIARAMAKEPEDRPGSAGELLLETERAFTRRLRAAMTPPGPIEVPAETGIRDAEINVPTREARAADSVVAETVTASPGETVSAPPNETLAAPPDETVAEPPEKTIAPVEAAPPASTVLSDSGVADASTAPAERAGPVFPAQLAPRLLALGGAVILVAALVGFIAGHSGTKKTTSSFGNLTQSGSLALKFPDGWERPASRPAIPGMDFKDPLWLGPTKSQSQDTLVAGQVAATGPALLSPGFLRRLPRVPARNDTVRLGKLEAYRYPNLQPRGFSKPLTLYVSPTTEGVATVACVGSALSSPFGRNCERAAASMELTKGKSFSLGPDSDYAKSLNKAMGDFNTGRTAGRKELRGLKTPSDQANIAGDLAHAYGVATGRVAKLTVSPAAQEANVSIVVALRRGAAGYEEMASAAKGNHRGKWNARGAAVRRADAALKKALEQLRQLGYSVK